MKRFLSGLLFTLWSSLACAGVTCTVPFNLQNNTVADATQVMANYNALITCFTNTAAAGVNSDITALFGLTTPLGATFGGTTAFVGGTSSGTNAQVVSATPNGFSLTNGYRVNFTVGSANTGVATLNVNSTGVASFLRQTPNGPIAMTGGELVAGQRVTAIVSGGGTQYELETPALQVGGLGPLASIASASTTDIGAAPNHFLQVTGVATINSLGSSANTVYPHYLLVFTSTATLTNSASLVLPTSANIVTAANDTAVAIYLGSGNWQIVMYQRATGLALAPPPAAAAVTVQRFTSGTSLTYTPTAGIVRIKVRECGGGGGGAADSTNSGSVGTDTSFAGWTAIHGNGGTTAAGAGGAGGTGGVNGTGTLVIRTNGGAGQGGGGGTNPNGGQGGNNRLGGGGSGAQTTAVGGAGATNTGAGGGGGSAGTISGGGGGAGECVEFWMTAAQVGASQPYTVGTGGAGGPAGTNAGGAGAAGVIAVEEFYF